MTDGELVAAFNACRQSVSYGEVSVAVYLFGIKHWRDLDGFDTVDLRRLSIEATGKNYGPALDTARKVGRYVKIVQSPHTFEVP